MLVKFNHECYVVVDNSVYVNFLIVCERCIFTVQRLGMPLFYIALNIIKTFIWNFLNYFANFNCLVFFLNLNVGISLLTDELLSYLQMLFLLCMYFSITPQVLRSFCVCHLFSFYTLVVFYAITALHLYEQIFAIYCVDSGSKNITLSR